MATVPNMRIFADGARSNGIMRKHGPPVRRSTEPMAPAAGASGPLQPVQAGGSSGLPLPDAAGPGVFGRMSSSWQLLRPSVPGGDMLGATAGGEPLGRASSFRDATAAAGTSKWF